MVKNLAKSEPGKKRASARKMNLHERGDDLLREVVEAILQGRLGTRRLHAMKHQRNIAQHLTRENRYGTCQNFIYIQSALGPCEFRVADPVHFRPDPDPAYQNFKYRIRFT